MYERSSDRDITMQGLDPVSLQPLERIEAEERAANDISKRESLEAQARFIGVAESSATRALRAVIEKKLMARIETLCKGDAVAKELLDLLKTLGQKHRIAQGAAEELHRKYYGTQE